MPRPYTKPQTPTPDPKLIQINAKSALLGAIELINWSRLASGSVEGLVANTDYDGFNRYWKTLIPNHGRWLCWIAFGIGAEGIVSAAFRIRNRKPATFGGTHGWKYLGLTPSEVAEVNDPILHLADVRNRDAHWYEANKRDEEFQFVKSEYVPALNLILKTIPRDAF